MFQFENMPAIVSISTASFLDQSNAYVETPLFLVISLCGVVVRCSRVESEVPGSRPTEFFIPSGFSLHLSRYSF